MLPAPRARSPVALLFVVALPFLATACLKAEKPAGVAALPEALTLAGQVRNLAGDSQGEVAIYAEELPETIGNTDATGAFAVTLQRDQFLRLMGTTRGAKGAFRLYFEKIGDATLAAASSPIGFDERGDRALGEITLGPTTTVTGKVMLQPRGKLAEPASGALVRLARGRVATNADGTFKLEGVPASTLVLDASAATYAPTRKDLSLSAGETKALDLPLMLFPETGITGHLTVMAPQSLASLVEKGHPFLRTLAVQGNELAKFVRFHHEEHVMLTSAWRDIQSTFDYDFPRDGGNMLFYQFADKDQKATSEVYRVQVILDQFGESKGLVVEDGSGLVTKRNILLHVDVPAAAFRMRIAESEDILLAKPWQKTASLLAYTLELRRDIAGGIEGFGQRTLYLQFHDALGLLSPVFKATFLVELFPAGGDDVFKINDGAAQSEHRLARLDINVPQNAFEMQIFEAPLDGQNVFNSATAGTLQDTGATRSTRGVWMRANARAFHVFPTPGLKTLYLQFRTAEGAMSPMYAQTIRILPFQEAGIGFVINGGAPVSATPHLHLTLIPPVTAIAFRVRENDRAFSPWLSLVPQHLHSVQAPGVHTLYVEYQNDDLISSPTHARTIQVDPFPPEVGQVVLNAGFPVTFTRMIDVAITAPPTARYMAIAEESFGGSSGNGLNSLFGGSSSASVTWQPVGPLAHFHLSDDIGAKLVVVKFKDENDDESAVIARTIFFDPFPTGAAGIVIDGGAATTADTTIEAAFVCPAHCKNLRYGLTPTLTAVPWMDAFSPAEITIPAGPGPVKVYVQYQTAEGNVSAVYFDEIDSTVPLVPPTP